MLLVRHQRIWSNAVECGGDMITNVKDFLPEERCYCVAERLTLSCRLHITGWRCVEQIVNLRPDSTTVPRSFGDPLAPVRFPPLVDEFVGLPTRSSICPLVSLFPHILSAALKSPSVTLRGNSLWDSHLELPFPPGLVPMQRGASS